MVDTSIGDVTAYCCDELCMKEHLGHKLHNFISLLNLLLIILGAEGHVYLQYLLTTM